MKRMSSRSEKIGKPMVIRRGKKKKKKKTVVGRNSEDIPCIPEDIVVYEILSRLPTKSLVRFRSVCKLWNSVITHDTDFKSRHVEAEAVVGFPLNHLFLVHIQVEYVFMMNPLIVVLKMSLRARL